LPTRLLRGALSALVLSFACVSSAAAQAPPPTLDETDLNGSISISPDVCPDTAKRTLA
jgi:hypothetical protein